jgi:hypothetical protein
MPNRHTDSIDQHVGGRIRMRRRMLNMTQPETPPGGGQRRGEVWNQRETSAYTSPALMPSHHSKHAVDRAAASHAEGQSAEELGT